MEFELIDICSQGKYAKEVEQELFKFMIPHGRRYNKSGFTFVQRCFIDRHTNKDFFKIPNMTIVNQEKCDKDVYHIFSDGGSFNNGYKKKDLPMFASSATIVFKNNKRIKTIANGYKDATNNFGELTGALLGIHEVENPKDSIIILSSDSQYVMKGISEWVYGWYTREWTTNEGEKIQNMELWKKLFDDYTLLDAYKNLLTCWVKGHTTNIIEKHPFYKINALCDKLCNEQINILLKEAGLPTRRL